MADKKPRALVIDDNSANLDVLTQLLLIEGCVCNRLSNVDDLSAELDKLHDVNVVFLDLHLPRMNGYDALKIIKNHSNFPNVYVIAYTVLINEMNTARDFDFDGFLGKPVNAEEFPDLLRRIFNGEHVWCQP